MFLSIQIPGLGTFGGSLGKLLATKLWLLPVGDFKKIVVPYFPDIRPPVLAKMNDDVKTLYHLCKAVISGFTICLSISVLP